MRSLTLAVLLLASACSQEQILSPITPAVSAPDAPEPGSPSLDALGVDGWHCPEELYEGSVRIANSGDGPLTIQAFAVRGEWSVNMPALPAVLEPGDERTLVAQGTGEGTLRIYSDDPLAPEVDVALTAHEDAPPVLSVLGPLDGDILGQGDLVDLVAFVDDDVDAPSTLEVTWMSDLDGTIGVVGAASDGLAELSWSALARSEGSHALSVSVEDSCGSVTELELPVCQQGGYTEENLDIQSWNFEGAATWNAVDSWLELTPVLTNQVGTAFETDHVVSGDNIDIAFDFYIGDGTGADGLSLTALDVNRMTTYLGGTGCGIGYGGDASCTQGPALPGWSIEVDTWYNDGQDPTEADHLMFTFDGDVDDGEVWVTLPEMEDTGWHRMEVRVVAPRVTVAIDGVTYIDQDIPGYFAFPAFVGFTAGTGSKTNSHRVDSLLVEQLICPEP